MPTIILPFVSEKVHPLDKDTILSFSFIFIFATLTTESIPGFISAMLHSAESAAYRYGINLGLQRPSFPALFTKESFALNPLNLLLGGLRYLITWSGLS